MRLLATTTSPFARKVLMAAHETGLAAAITFVPTETASEALGRENPLNKVPTLILEDGTTLFDSPVICEYLDSLHTGQPLFPAPGPSRWRSLREQALGDGICDAAVLRMLEGRRPPERQWDEWTKKQTRKLTQGLDELERMKRSASDDSGAAAVTIGDLALLAALGYLDFRFAGDQWRAQRPGLAAWFARTSDRASFRATMPVG